MEADHHDHPRPRSFRRRHNLHPLYTAAFLLPPSSPPSSLPIPHHHSEQQQQQDVERRLKPQDEQDRELREQDQQQRRERRAWKKLERLRRRRERRRQREQQAQHGEQLLQQHLQRLHRPYVPPNDVSSLDQAILPMDMNLDLGPSANPPLDPALFPTPGLSYGALEPFSTSAATTVDGMNNPGLPAPLQLYDHGHNHNYNHGHSPTFVPNLPPTPPSLMFPPTAMDNMNTPGLPTPLQLYDHGHDHNHGHPPTFIPNLPPTPPSLMFPPTAMDSMNSPGLHVPFQPYNDHHDHQPTFIPNLPPTPPPLIFSPTAMDSVNNPGLPGLFQPYHDHHDHQPTFIPNLPPTPPSLIFPPTPVDILDNPGLPGPFQPYHDHHDHQPTFIPNLLPTPPSLISPPTDLPLPFHATSEESSLDNQIASHAQVIGMSGECDPFMISRLRSDHYDEAPFRSTCLRKMHHRAPAPGDVPAFFTTIPNALVSQAQPQPQPPDDPATLHHCGAELHELIGEELGQRLLGLFHRYVQPYFPILARQGPYPRDGDDDVRREPPSLPTHLLAAIYGHALPFWPRDDTLRPDRCTPPSPDAVFRIAWRACQPAIHTPSLAVLQTLMLLLQRPPTNQHLGDTAFLWTIMATAVGIAQTLGLNRDPSHGSLPDGEIRVRKRLAWAVFVQDKLLALTLDRGSHIQVGAWDVPPLTEDDLVDAHPLRTYAGAGAPDSQHFIKLCELALMVDEILQQLCRLRASKDPHGDLKATLRKLKPLRIRVTQWYESLPAHLLPGSAQAPSLTSRIAAPDLPGHSSLQLACMTAKMELFRAMLRPPVWQVSAAAIIAMRSDARTVARKALTFLKALGAPELEAFWPSYAPAHFTIASSFMLLLFVTARTWPEAFKSLRHLTGWHAALQLKVQTHPAAAGPLLHPALLRLDTVFALGLERLFGLSLGAALAWFEYLQGIA